MVPRVALGNVWHAEGRTDSTFTGPCFLHAERHDATRNAELRDDASGFRWASTGLEPVTSALSRALPPAELIALSGSAKESNPAVARRIIAADHFTTRNEPRMNAWTRQ